MYRNILVPVAFDDDDSKVKAALDAARALAGEGATITLLHVIESVPSYAIAYMPADFVAETRKAIESELQGLAESVPGGKAVIVDGHSGRTILDYAQDHENDLIVIASHRPGMQDLLIGSTAAQVVRHAKCAVHVLR